MEKLQMVITSAIGGDNVTTTIEGRERFPVNVRYPRELREDVDRVRAGARADAARPPGAHQAARRR
ncbi:MAG: hypothetical protein U0166_09630 [Acidobacteriota bacterium]